MASFALTASARTRLMADALMTGPRRLTARQRLARSAGIGVASALVLLGGRAEARPFAVDVEFAWDWLEFSDHHATITLEDTYTVRTSAGDLEPVTVTLDWRGRTKGRTIDPMRGLSFYTFGHGQVDVTFAAGPNDQSVGSYRGRALPFAFTIDDNGATMDDMAEAHGRGRPDAALAQFLGVSRRAGWFDFDFLADIVVGGPGEPRQAHSGCCSYFSATLAQDVPEPRLLHVPALVGIMAYEWRRRRHGRR